MDPTTLEAIRTEVLNFRADAAYRARNFGDRELDAYGLAARGMAREARIEQCGRLAALRQIADWLQCQIDREQAAEAEDLDQRFDITCAGRQALAASLLY